MPAFGKCEAVAKSCSRGPYVVGPKTIRRTMEMLREVLYHMDIGPHRALRVVATLELVQHHLPKMGHKSLLVTQTLHSL